MIESVSESNLDDVLPLIRMYQKFYKIKDIDDKRNKAFFSQFNEQGDKGCLFLYRNNAGEAVAFATVYFTYVSSIPAKVGVMNDLYTIQSHRGKGIARKLINHCLEFAINKGAARLQWLTSADNKQAQQLYDSLDTKKSSWIVYTYSTSA